MIQCAMPKNLYLLFLLLPLIIFFIRRLQYIKKINSAFFNNKICLHPFYFQSIFFVIAAFFLVLTFSIPQWGSRAVTVRKRGSSIYFVFDISRSMTVSDILPNRLSAAKQYAKLLIEELQESACGLVLTKGNGVLSVPLSFSHRELINAIHALSPLSLSSGGTDLEAGIISALNAFPKNHAAAKIIILLSDGDETKGDIFKAARQTIREGATLIIVGVGTEEGAKIKITTEHNTEALITTQLQKEKLMRAAQSAINDSMYVSILDTTALKKIISIIEKKSTNVGEVVYVQKPVRRVYETTLLACFFLCLSFASGGIRCKE